jgi:hypothetical protein
MINSKTTNKETLQLEETELNNRYDQLINELSLICLDGVKLPDKYKTSINSSHPYCVTVRVFKQSRNIFLSHFPIMDLSLCNSDRVQISTMNPPENKPQKKDSPYYCGQDFEILESIENNLILNGTKLLELKKEITNVSERLYELCYEIHISQK